MRDITECSEGLAVTGSRIVPLVDEGLGNSAYLVDLADGRALAVDVSRDLRAVRAAAGRLLAEHNRRGPAVLTAGPGLAALAPEQVRALAAGGFQIVDVRPVDAYTAGHIPGSLANPLRAAFATWLGWLVPSPGTSFIFVRDPDQDPGEIAWQALKIGYGSLAGELSGGLPAWANAGLPVAVTSLITPAEVDPARVVDVRQASEYASGHLPGARNIELGALAGHAGALIAAPVVTMCGHGERAAAAASVLERAGHTRVALLPGGPPDWADATGLALEAGS